MNNCPPTVSTFGEVAAQRDMLERFVKNDRIIVGRNLRIIQQDNPLKLEIPTMERLIEQLRANQQGNDAKDTDTDVAVALAATVGTVAGIAWGSRWTFKDSADQGDFRQLVVTFTWTDVALRTMNVTVEPNRGRPGELWLLTAFLSNGRTVLAQTNAAGITATVAADTQRPGAINELENQVSRDIEFLARR